MKKIAILCLVAAAAVANAQTKQGVAIAHVSAAPGPDRCVFTITPLSGPYPDSEPSGPSITREAVIVVDTVDGRPQNDFRICKDDANSWPNATNRVSVHTKSSSTGAVGTIGIVERFSAKPGFLSPPKGLNAN